MSIPDGEPLVSIYLHGHDLDPAAVSAELRVTATRSGSRGEIIKSPTSDAEGIRKIGFWKITAKSKSLTLSDHLAELRSVFTLPRRKLTSLPGVDDAYLDVYVSATWVADGKTVTRELSASDIEFMAELGLALQFTTSVDVD